MTSFGIEEATANGSLALKHTYLRYLDPYEKVHFHREEEETNDDWADAEDSRLSRHKKAKVESTVPSNYNYRYVHLLIQKFFLRWRSLIFIFIIKCTIKEAF